MNDPKGKAYISGGKRFFGMSRSEKRANNNLGIIQNDQSKRIHRSDKLYKAELYLEGGQYNNLAPWQECCSTETYTAIRKRKPSVIFPFAKIYQDRLASKLVGQSTFPKMSVQDDEETTYFLGIVKKASFFEAKMLDAAKLFISYTSCFVRFSLMAGSPKIEVYNSNYCYPEFSDDGQLISVSIKYIYETTDIDEAGKPIMKWYRLDLGQESDILYDNPIYVEGQNEPEFSIVNQVDHGLGFVQGEWFRNGETNYDIDGHDYPMACQLSGFIDAINYNLSQSDSATSYGLDPQLILKKIEEDELDMLIKSSSKAWALGREGDAAFLEITGSGVATAEKTEQRLMKMAADAARIVFLDPEKTVGSAQSGKAMEVLHSSMVEMINELRPWFEKSMTMLMQKIIATMVIYNQQGAELALVMPPMWQPQSLDITTIWPPIFPLTIQDMQQIVSIGLQASNGNIIARDTAAKWIQSQGVDFGVEDWDLETEKINNQKTFGGFF
jgi:hypothetical protein